MSGAEDASVFQQARASVAAWLPLVDRLPPAVRQGANWGIAIARSMAAETTRRKAGSHWALPSKTDTALET